MDVGDGTLVALSEQRPRFNQTLLPLRKRACEDRDRRDRKYRFVLLVVGVEMGNVMSLGRLNLHSNDHSKKT